MKDKEKFIDKVVIITGASSGIGRATSLAFAREGASTVLVSRTAEKLEKVANEIRKLNPNVLIIPTDVSLQDSIRNMIEKVMAEYGRVDILVNNAGTAHVGPISHEKFVEDTKEMMAVDFYGTVYCTKAVLPIMQRHGRGHIVNMSSVVGRKAFPHFAGYSVSMHAITAFSDALRQELHGSGIYVSIIHPALTQTAMLSHISPADMPPPFRRMTPITAESVAEAVLDAVHKKHLRVILPSQPKRLLLADAISPRLGDRIVRLMPNRVFASLIGIYRGKMYEHDTSY
ncbi:MAG: SDR family oxidoreductase [Deltaproteobacteria bacterium]|nr:SDR family oxidoreductase [Deltaproteobacteria bacterium]